MPVRLTRTQFDALVDEAVDHLPAWVGEHMENVYVTTAMWPTREQLESSRVGRHALLLGLYEGVPLTRRGHGYHLITPDRITLFQRSLELVADDDRDLVQLIQGTIVHEIGHHFGMSEEELDRLESQD